MRHADLVQWNLNRRSHSSCLNTPRLVISSLAKAFHFMPWMCFGNSLLVSADLPYSWDFLVENLMDPSHVAFSHHGILGKRYALSSTPQSVPHIDFDVSPAGCQVFRWAS